jgi:transcriptional regulator with XRE-family HTH domain
MKQPKPKYKPVERALRTQGARRLREWLNNKTLSINTAALRLGVTEAQLRSWATCRSLPTVVSAHRIEKKIGIPASLWGTPEQMALPSTPQETKVPDGVYQTKIKDLEYGTDVMEGPSWVCAKPKFLRVVLENGVEYHEYNMTSGELLEWVFTLATFGEVRVVIENGVVEECTLSKRMDRVIQEQMAAKY